MCSVTKQYKTMKGDYLAEDNIFNQLVQGEYELDDYILIDSHGEIQAVSGNSDFWEDGVVPRKDYIALTDVRFINPDVHYPGCDGSGRHEEGCPNRPISRDSDNS